MIVAIDGPAGSGKSTTARAVAQRLGFRHLDSGAFYRALTLAALRAGIAPETWQHLAPEDLDALGVRGEPADNTFRLLIGNDDISADIRSPAVTAHVSEMAQLPAVRTWLLGRLRNAARAGNLVADGRDMGTVVFPDAELKIFLTADPETRARRRLAQEGKQRPSQEEIAAEIARLRERDRTDSERAVAPLRQAAGAVPIDTSGLGFDEQVDAIVRLVEARRSARPSSS